MLTREEAHTSISRHRDGKFDANDVGKLIHQIYNEFEAQLIVKDEEIKKLKAERDHFHNKYIAIGVYISDYIKDKKARSIVAMLFWEWRKAETRYQTECKTKRDNRQLSLLSISSSKSEVLFKQAYKILKDKA